MENLKIYDMVINDIENSDESLGVDIISLVEHPAVEVDFLKFSKEKEYQKYEIDNEKQIVYGVIMLADVPIYRRNEQFGEHYTIFSKDTIEKIMIKYFKEKKINNVNLEHQINVDGVTMFQSYIVDSNLGVNAPAQFENITDGSWIGAFKVSNEAVWNDIKEGKFKGFSIEGFFGYGEEVTEDAYNEETEIRRLIELIHKDLAKIK